jgi:hypothetical protein
MTEKNLKNYLIFDQYYGKPYYIKLRVLLSVAIGVITGIFSQDHIGMFVVVTVVCLVVLLWFPKMRIGFKAPQVYRRNRSGAFHQSQDFAFGETRVGFKSESEEEYDWTPYHQLNRIIETKTLLIMEYSPQQRTIMVKDFIEEEDLEKIRGYFRESIGDKFVTMNRL